MGELTIYKEGSSDFTVISNLFIDYYMKDANDAQLKVYLYLVRMIHAGCATSVSDIADQFNHTEKDILRSLKYWEKKGVLALEYDSSRNLCGIRLLELRPQSDRAADLTDLSRQDLPAPKVSSESESAEASDRPVEIPTALVKAARVTVSTPTVSPQPAERYAETREGSPFEKPNYSAAQIREFQSRSNTQQLIFIASQYIGRPLTAAEMKTILFFTDTLSFSDDLIDYLLQYCVDRGKKDFKYIEKVAVSWAQEGITTPRQAQKRIGKYDKNVYLIMNELGRSGSPTPKELEYINRWLKEYGFDAEIIAEACQRTVLATDKHRFEYTEGILKSWFQEGVHHKGDILRIDEQHQKKRTTPPVKPAVGSKFNQFSQNSYDFSALEHKLISN